MTSTAAILGHMPYIEGVTATIFRPQAGWSGLSATSFGHIGKMGLSGLHTSYAAEFLRSRRNSCAQDAVLKRRIEIIFPE